jgi:hypothetical protein
MKVLYLWLVPLTLIGTSSPVRAADPKVKIEAQEPWTNLFADKDVVLQFRVAAPADFKGRLAWTFAAAANQRVYDRGRGEAPIAAEAKRAPVKVMLRTPPLKPAVVQEAELTVTLEADGQKEPANTYKKKIWIFPADPFPDRKKWLEGLEIKLFDPDPKTKTAAALKDLEVPFEDVPRVGGLDDVKAGVIVIGEGASFKDEPELMPALVRAAQRGVHVLCLAPAAGNFALPGSDAQAAADSLSLRRQDIIRKLDKRFDADAWPPEGKVVASSLALKADEGKVVADVLADPKGWPWLAVDFPAKKGRLVVCGFSLLGAWEQTPTPRYLLAAMLEHLTADPDASPRNEGEKTPEKQP